jgi:hypothetical protein
MIEEFFKEVAPHVLACARSRRRSLTKVEDVAQEINLKLLKLLEQNQPPFNTLYENVMDAVEQIKDVVGFEARNRGRTLERHEQKAQKIRMNLAKFAPLSERAQSKLNTIELEVAAMVNTLDTTEMLDLLTWALRKTAPQDIDRIVADFGWNSATLVEHKKKFTETTLRKRANRAKHTLEGKIPPELRQTLGLADPKTGAGKMKNVIQGAVATIILIAMVGLFVVEAKTNLRNSGVLARGHENKHDILVEKTI